MTKTWTLTIGKFKKKMGAEEMKPRRLSLYDYMTNKDIPKALKIPNITEVLYVA